MNRDSPEGQEMLQVPASGNPEHALPEQVGSALIHALLDEELARFMEEYEQPRFSVAQQYRTFLIEYIAVSVPMLVPVALIDELGETVDALKTRDDYQVDGWHRMLPLDASLFTLTQDYSFLDYCRYNVDHHNSLLRRVALDALSLVAPELSLDDDELWSRVEHNLAARHIYGELGVLLLAATESPLEARLQVLRRWLEKPMNEHERTTLQGLVRGEPVANEFAEHWSRVGQYVLFRLAQVHRKRLSEGEQMPLPSLGASRDAEETLAEYEMEVSLFRGLLTIPPLVEADFQIQEFQDPQAEQPSF